MTGPLPRRRRPPVAVGLAVAVAATALGAAGYAAAGRPGGPAAAAGPPPTATAAIVRGTVTERVQVPGTLGFAGSHAVVHQGPPGILTAAPAPGRVVRRGQALYAVAGRPALLLLGAIPAYRDFRAGMAPGPDVRQLERNLVALRLDAGRRITVDDRFTAATRAAVRRWQARLGWPAVERTGELPLGDVVFLPTPLRVATADARLGASVAPGQPVLAGTSPDRAVTAQLPADRQGLVRAGDQVLVTLPGLAPVRGRVATVDRVATVPDDDGAGGTDRATVAVIVAVTLPAGAPELDQAPAQVAITTDSRAGVLLVPVTALVARPGGGYAVRLAGGAGVQVRPGLFDDAAGTVEVSGDGLAAGQLVQVPAP